VFDVMVLDGRNVMGETLATRWDLLTCEVLRRLAAPAGFLTWLSRIAGLLGVMAAMIRVS